MRLDIWSHAEILRWDPGPSRAEQAAQSTNLARIKFAIVWIAVRAQEMILEILLCPALRSSCLVSTEHYIDIIKIGLGPLYFLWALYVSLRERKHSRSDYRLHKVTFLLIMISILQFSVQVLLGRNLRRLVLCFYCLPNEFSTKTKIQDCCLCCWVFCLSKSANLVY